MANQKIFYWRVTVELPGNSPRQASPDTPLKEGGRVTVEPIAADKLQASHRAAVMLGLLWRDVARYMTISGPYKALAERVRQWNREYPAWSTEREDPAARSVRTFTERR